MPQSRTAVITGASRGICACPAVPVPTDIDAVRAARRREFFTALGIDHLLEIPVDATPTGEEKARHDA